MKTLGLIGGMSWESTIPYYRHINEAVKEKLGGLHSAKIVLYSVDFAEIEACQRDGDWEAAGRLLAAAGKAVEAGGAEILILCTNTMHKVAPAIEAAIGIPMVHIADATAEAVLGAGFTSIGLLGTSFTMEQDFYKARLADRFGLQVLVPGKEDRDLVHRVIYQELCLGTVNPASRLEFRRIIAELVAGGAQGVILGCTEIGLLVGSGDASVPLFDTAELHARKAASLALG
jgi:aspartate racemase